ncbi:MAG: hypothetical protein H0V36_06350 [Chloroflexi bacterium]|nr:hypothetical protein [Chloroflexota bacterium]
MSRSLLTDAFEHHVWATLRLVDACLPLSPEQLGTAAPGTYGSILDTMRHLVGSDSSYLFTMTGGRTALIKEDGMDLPALRAAMEANGAAWFTAPPESLLSCLLLDAEDDLVSTFIPHSRLPQPPRSVAAHNRAHEIISSSTSSISPSVREAHSIFLDGLDRRSLA